jgi:GNAT superfamily N-acetyltransferase
MPVMSLIPDRLVQAAEVLGLAMEDDPFLAYVVPQTDERIVLRRWLYADTIARAMADGRVDVWGDPIVGVAVWLRRAAIDAPDTPASGPADRPTLAGLLGPDAVARAGRFGAVMRELRRRARPDRHAYLDSLGVLQDHRRTGIASALLTAGHGWADAEGLPCALDTLTDANIAFYRRRGYAVVAGASVPGSDLTLTAMRRL